MRGETPTLALAGDVMLGRLMNDVFAARGPSDAWEGVRPWIDDADALVYNLECAICGDLPEWEPVTKAFHFRLDPEHVDAVRASGVDAVTLANNHVLDFDVAGLESTLAHLDGLGVARAGAGRDLDEASRPAFVDVAGVRVAVVAFADHLVEWAAGPGEPGIRLVRVSTRDADFSPVREAIAEARRDADFVLFGIHWGPNMREAPTPGFRAFAHAVLDAGADAFWGTSAHVFQGVEVRDGKPILYDAGDFLDDYAVDAALRNDVSFLFRLAIEDGAARALRLDPVLIRDFRVAPAPPAEARWARERMAARSRAFATRFDAADARALRVDLAPSAAP